MVSIAAFQAVDPSSILGHRIVFLFCRYPCFYNYFHFSIVVGFKWIIQRQFNLFPLVEKWNNFLFERGGQNALPSGSTPPPPRPLPPPPLPKKIAVKIKLPVA